MALDDWVVTKSAPVKQDNGNIKIVLTYTHVDGQVFTQELLGNDLTDDYIAKIAAVRIGALEDSLKVLSTVAAGAVTPVVVDQISDQQKFSLAAQNLVRLKQRVQLGIIDEDSEEYKDATALAKSLYQLGF